MIRPITNKPPSGIKENMFKDMDDGKSNDVRKSKNRHLMVVNKLRKKEEDWNPRFYLDNIPEYHFVDDKHCETYKQMLAIKKSQRRQLKRKAIDDQTLSRGLKKILDGQQYLLDESPKKRPDSSFERYDDNKLAHSKSKLKKPLELIDVNDEEKRQSLEKTLYNAWLTYNIPQFHQDIFKQCIATQNIKVNIDIMNKEINDLQNNKAYIQNTIKTITARENCLKQLKDIINQIESRNVNNNNNNNTNTNTNTNTNIVGSPTALTDEVIIEKCSQLLTHLRILSISVVECIVRWREYLQHIYFTSRCMLRTSQTLLIIFLYNDSNYLLKMKHDTRDLHNSPLAQYFNFSTKSDPFFNYPSKEIEDPTSKKYILYISKNLINRIKASELVLLEESAHEQLNEKGLGMKIGENQGSDIVHKTEEILHSDKKSSKSHLRKGELFSPSRGDDFQLQKMAYDPKLDTKKKHVIVRQYNIKNHGKSGEQGVPSSITTLNSASGKRKNSKEANQYDGKNIENNNIKKPNDDQLDSALRPKSKLEARKNLPSRSGVKRLPTPKNRLQNLNKGDGGLISPQNPDIAQSKNIIKVQPKVLVNHYPKSLDKIRQSSIQTPKINPRLTNEKVNNNNTNNVQATQNKQSDGQSLTDNENNVVERNKVPEKPKMLYESNAIEPLEINEEKIIPIMETYFEKIDPIIRESFLCNAQLLLKKANLGQEPRWFKIKSIDKMNKQIHEVNKDIQDGNNKGSSDGNKDINIVDKGIGEDVHKEVNAENKEIGDSNATMENKEIGQANKEPAIENKENTEVKKESTTENKDAIDNNKEASEANKEITDAVKANNSSNDDANKEITDANKTNHYSTNEIPNGNNEATTNKEPNTHINANDNDDDGFGYAVVHIDNSNFTLRRLIILHFSVINKADYGKYLLEFISYLWKYDSCKEIKVGLYQIQDENQKMIIDKALQTCYTSIGFKWKQMINDKLTGKRNIDYVIKRPEDIPCEMIAEIPEPISIKSVLLMGSIEESSDDNTPNFNNQVDNRYNIISGLLEHCDERLDKLADSDNLKNQNYISVISSQASKEWIKIGNITQKFDNSTTMHEFVMDKMQNEEVIPRINGNQDSAKITASLMNICYRWKSINLSYYTLDDNKTYKYIRINNNEELMKFSSTYMDCTIYFIPTDDQEANIFIIDQPDIISNILQNKSTIEDTLSNIFQKLNKNPQVFNDDIWIPSFKLGIKNHELSELKLIFKGEYALNKAIQNTFFQVESNLLPGTLKLIPNSNSRIIKDSFIFGILNDKIDIPIFSALINKDNFLILNGINP